MEPTASAPGATAPTASTSPADDALDRELLALLARRDVHAVFQPVVELRTGEVVGLEALARGPLSSPLENPRELFAAAERCGRTAELDWVCRATAFSAVLDADVPPSMSIFVNVEPGSLGAECPEDLRTVVSQAESLLRVFVEVNDRAITTDPAALLAAVDRAREMGWGVAIDDVGSSRAPIPMLPVTGADMVKVDLSLLRAAEPADRSAILLSALQHVEQTGASLCVERIEDEDDLRWAIALGARYGQGRHLGMPGPLAAHYPPPRAVPPVTASADEVAVAAPYVLVEDRESRLVTLPELMELARLVAYTENVPGVKPIVLFGMGRDGLQTLLDTDMPRPDDGALLAVGFGTGSLSEPVGALRTVRTLADDPLAAERFLVVLNEYGAYGVFGRETGDGRFEVVLTRDADLVHCAARQLMRRVPPPGGDDRALEPRWFDVEEEPEHATSAGAAGASSGRGGWRGRLGRHG